MKRYIVSSHAIGEKALDRQRGLATAAARGRAPALVCQLCQAAAADSAASRHPTGENPRHRFQINRPSP